MNSKGINRNVWALILVGAVTSLLVVMGSMAWAASNLNMSKSNCCRYVYDRTVVTPAQAAAIGGELDKIGPGINEAKVLQLLRARGINAPNLIVRIVPAGQGGGKTPTILIVTSPDEAQARHIAVSDSAPQPSPPPIIRPK